MGRRLALRPAVGLIAALAALAPAGGMGASPLGAQEDPARRDTAAADTLPWDSLPPRERALHRLRALPATPIQRAPGDTLAADSAAEIVVADSAAPAADRVPSRELGRRPGQRPIPPDSAPPGAPGEPGEPGDTAGRDARGAMSSSDPGVVLREDSVLARLRALDGYVITEYRGETAVFRADSNRLRLTGASRVAREGSSLETDSVLVYAGDRGVVCGYGNPVLSGETDPVESDRVCFDIERDMGEAVGARTKFVQGATWYVRGAENRVYLLTGRENNELYGEKAEFTSCDLPTPHYVFRARSLKMVEDNMMVARNVTLEFEDVPVFWLPWMVQSMKRGRKSGLLMPEFGVNDIVRNSTGYNRHLSNLGFYWAINDYLGARGTFEWYSNNYTAVEGALSYRWRRQFLDGQWTVKQYWRELGGTELTINTGNSWQPDERTSLRLSGSYATSTDFVRNNSFDPRELNRRITSSGSINRSFDWGQVSLGAQRNQDISTDKTDLTLPQLTLSLRPLTLYSSDDGSLALTWNGSGSASRRSLDVQEAVYPGVRDQDQVDAQAQHSLSFGRLSLSQSVTYQDQELGFKPVVGTEADSLFAPGAMPGEILLPDATETLRWTTSVGYQQDLWTGTTLTPSLSINGNQLRSDATGDAFVAGPSRLSAGASLATTIFGFWPGVADFSRIRHKISPRLSWRYAPEVEPTAAQRAIFGTTDFREQNQLTLSFDQTFEAKVESDDTAGVDPESSVVNDAGASGEPRRLPQAEKVMLLAINTSGPFTYDFVSAREEGRGFLTDRVSNSIRSDLLKNLTLSMSHDLFAEGADSLAEEGRAPSRRFDPFLTSLNASFRIDDDFWLFRMLGLALGGGADEVEETEGQRAEGVGGSEDPTLAGEADVEQVPGAGSIVPGRGGQESGIRRGVGGWQASLDYSLSRFRASEGAAAREAQQTLRGNMSFQPTEHWSLRWSTSYSFTAGEFNDHVLTLTRDLHRWQANFDFIKAQNGNFLFTFRVQLTDNPDLKLDYDQRTDPSDRFEDSRRTPSAQTQ